jgi:hypothetical protein
MVFLSSLYRISSVVLQLGHDHFLPNFSNVLFTIYVIPGRSVYHISWQCRKMMEKKVLTRLQKTPFSKLCNTDRLCGLVVRVPGYRSRGPVSIPGVTRFSQK